MTLHGTYKYCSYGYEYICNYNENDYPNGLPIFRCPVCNARVKLAVIKIDGEPSLILPYHKNARKAIKRQM